METKISVIGLGKLGAPLAACLAAKGLPVIGVDVNAVKVETLRQGRAPVMEPNLEAMIRASNGRLHVTSSILDAVRGSEITFIVVGTPSEPGGGFSLKQILPVCQDIGRGLKEKNSFHLVVLTSTVMPGTTEGPVREAIEQASGKRAPADFGLCYNPEFIALGSVIRDFLNPDFVLIGESDERSGAMLEQVYRAVCDRVPSFARMSPINAEIAKLAVNTFVTTKISYANMLARICEHLPGANVDVVTAAIGLDSRIGSKFLKGAVSYGGPCFPRDNLAMAALARSLGAPGGLAETTHEFNRLQTRLLAALIERHLPPGGRVAILGLTYKPQTDVVEESAGLLLARELVARNIRLGVYDPAGNQNASRAAGPQLPIAATAQNCVEEADVAVLMTPWPEFCRIPVECWERPEEPRVVIDCWRVLPHLRGRAGIVYLPLGIGNEAAQAAVRADGKAHRSSLGESHSN